MTTKADVVIVGAGPAGLTAATVLARSCQLNVLVLERESATGGIPRHSAHLGYGIRDMKTVLGGPAYARRLTERAAAAGVEIRTGTMATGWATERILDITSARGRERIEARAVILATGARERPRSARMISGDRPSGIYTTGQLQNQVHVHHGEVGQRAVIVGAELVSHSAVLTLRAAGCATVLMTSVHGSPESYGLFNVAARSPLLGVDVATRTRVTRIIGSPTLRGVEVEDLDSGARRIVDCDTLVLTGDWIPDNELARSGGLDIDPKSLGPLVDSALRTSRAGVFAIGNLLHPVDTADIAALDGRHVVDHVLAYLAGRAAPPASVRIVAEAPLCWVTPGLLRPGDPAPPRHRLVSWSDELIRFPTIVASQDSRVVATRTLPWPCSPGRAFRIPSGVLDAVDRRGGPVLLSVTGSSRWWGRRSA